MRKLTAIKTRVLSILMVVVTFFGSFAGLLEVLSTPACAANTVAEGEYFISSILTSDATSYLMDVEDCVQQNGTNIQLWQNDSYNAAETFYIQPVGSGWYRISLSCNRNYVLDVCGGNSASQTNLQLYSWNGTDSQLFCFEDAGNGFVRIRNKLGCYVDVCGGTAYNHCNIWLYTGNQTDAQSWRLTPKSQVTNAINFINNGNYCNGASWGSSKRPRLSSYGSYGCCAYAADFAKYVAGLNSPKGVSSYSSTKYISDGDILKFTNSQHWVVVIRRYGNKLTTIEGNWNGKVVYSSSTYTISNGRIYRNGKAFRTFYAGYHLA